MRRLITIALLSYIFAHTVYFLYSFTHVPYTRRGLSKRELSDGPLVLKDGVAVKKLSKVTPLNKKQKQKIVKKAKHSGGTKLYTATASKPAVRKNVVASSVPKESLPKLNRNFVERLVQEARGIYKLKGLVYFTIVNGAFERLTLNWLCNVAAFESSLELLLIVSTAKELCDSVHEEYGEEVHCMVMRLPGFEVDLDWGDQKYIDFLTIRAQLMEALTESGVRFVLIETDSTWFRDPLELFLNATLVDDADIVAPIKGLIHKGDSLAFSPMLVEPTDTSIVLFNEITKRIQGNNTLYDQDVLNELCSIQYHGVVCRNFEYNEIADGKWFYLRDDDKSFMQPYIVNNNFYVGLKNKEARQAISGLWFLTRTGHCSMEKVERARKRFLG